MSAGAGSKELLNVLGECKARVQDKLGVVEFPMPQFILIGKQSVGKSRLIEALAGETFNFISGTLGSRRPTVLEFRNVPTHTSSRWFVRDRNTNQWEEQPIASVMKKVGDAHEELGETVSKVPVYVRLESADCVDMQIVDLPGFRDFAMDQAKQALSGQIETLVTEFMQDKRNVMLCVEQASDAANMSTLQKCRNVDKDLERTVLIRNKLDKYYGDLNSDNVNQWVNGFGDLPEGLQKFSLTLPFWKEGSPPPKSFVELREDMHKEDVRQMASKSISKKFETTIGFNNFAAFMSKKIEKMFGDALTPVLTNLRDMKKEGEIKVQEKKLEFNETNPQRILSTTRDCGVSFATALRHVMEGVLDLKPVMNLEEELREFHSYHAKLGSQHFSMLPTLDFAGLSDYIDYLRKDICVAAFDVEVNGGAQFRRLMNEVEIFLRFSEIAVETKKKDVIQARGVSMSSLTWRDVVVKLLSNEAHLPLQHRVQYVGERLKWFFENQKDAVLQFMDSLENTPAANLYSPLYSKHAKLIKSNTMIKHLVYQTYDAACKRQLDQFVELFDSMLTSTFSNPWVFLKGAAGADDEDGSEDLLETVMPSFDDTKQRIPQEIMKRAEVETMLSRWLANVPTESHNIDEAVDKVQILVLRAYGFIRSQVCDQVELFSESFFKLPMLRRLEEDMAQMKLSEADEAQYKARRDNLTSEIKAVEEGLVEINGCIDRLQDFKLKCDA